MANCPFCGEPNFKVTCTFCGYNYAEEQRIYSEYSSNHHTTINECTHGNEHEINTCFHEDSHSINSNRVPTNSVPNINRAPYPVRTNNSGTGYNDLQSVERQKNLLMVCFITLFMPILPLILSSIVFPHVKDPKLRLQFNLVRVISIIVLITSFISIVASLSQEFYF